MPSRFHAIGDLRRRCRIEQETRSADGGGGFTISWTEVCTVWAKVWPVISREALSAERLEARVDTLIVIRYRAGLNAGMRATVDGVSYQIHGVIDPQSRREWLELNCQSGVAT